MRQREPLRRRQRRLYQHLRYVTETQPTVRTHSLRMLLAGSFQCQCLPGFSFDSSTRTCISIDECAVTAIATLCLPGDCQNTIGSYRCICPAGYEATNTRLPPSPTISSTNNIITNEVAIIPAVTQACVDINECVRNPNLCAPGNCLTPSAVTTASARLVSLSQTVAARILTSVQTKQCAVWASVETPSEVMSVPVHRVSLSTE